MLRRSVEYMESVLHEWFLTKELLTVSEPTYPRESGVAGPCPHKVTFWMLAHSLQASATLS